MRRRRLGLCLLAWLSCGPARAAYEPPWFAVKESALNQFASAVGSFSGQTGLIRVYVRHPCFPDFWNLCDTTLAEDRVRWTLSNVVFQIRPAGITFTGRVLANYAGFTLNPNVSGGASVSYSAANDQLHLAVNQVNVPIQISFPLLGALTITTLAVDPHYGFDYAVGRTSFQVPRTAGGFQTLHLDPGSLRPLLEFQQVRIESDIAIW